LTPVLERNIGALMKRRAKEQAAAGIQQKIADAITAFTGSMTFVYPHLAVFGFWIAANLKRLSRGFSPESIGLAHEKDEDDDVACDAGLIRGSMSRP
jgi:hypothetical protein